jgi:peptidyl-tRNA hydrolase
MASKLTRWINAKLKKKGLSVKEAKKNAGKYSSIAAAKRAGSLYYTDKKGRIMIAAYAEDLKDAPPPKKTSAPKKSPRPIKRPTKKKETVSNRQAEKDIDAARGKIKIAEAEARLRATKKRIEELDKKIADLLKESKKETIQRKVNILNKTAQRFKDTKVAAKKYLKRIEKEAKEGGKGPESVTVVAISGSTRPKRRPVLNRTNDSNPRKGYESGRDDMQSLPRYLQDIRTNPSARRKKKITKAKGGLIDMRNKGLFK